MIDTSAIQGVPELLLHFKFQYLLKLQNMADSATQTMVTSKEEIQQMMAMWPSIVRDIMEATENLNIPGVSKWLEKVLEYNVPGGKKMRSLALIYAYKMLVSNDKLTGENIHLARILAWCVELVQGCFLLIDDIQDRSLFRRGKPCWYRYNDIGVAALNDGLMLKSAVFYLIQKHFKGKACYVDLIELFEDIGTKSLIGQSLDMFSTNFNKKSNLDLFTMERYISIAEYKTAYYTIFLPITAAMHSAGIKDPEMFRQSKAILIEMGRLYQIQDDYLDCYGSVEVFGKDNTDIQEGKCTWFVVVALQRATPEQRNILEECYGVSDPEKVKRVKQLYDVLNLQDAYSTYENEAYKLINEHIRQISCGLPQKLFLDLLGKLYRRMS